MYLTLAAEALRLLVIGNSSGQRTRATAALHKIALVRGRYDREPPRVQDVNGRKSPNPAIQFPRGTNEGTTAVCVSGRADVSEKKERTDEDQKRDARVRRLEEKEDEEEKKWCNGEDETEVLRAATTRGTRSVRSEVERHERCVGARRVTGRTWLIQVCDRLCSQINPLLRRVRSAGEKVWRVKCMLE
ncbi:hypothetical protein NDU88_005071 [Pleurodeles waltl]|uniref:Uncharacterized protein n=1 Tax=Pleurodeles waltl TaxID=8319 RepID=A0AAV7MIC5_PLEWA|nr:hypothetical protein NDU88_005071 [Pleurodeles waltl]